MMWFLEKTYFIKEIKYTKIKRKLNNMCSLEFSNKTKTHFVFLFCSSNFTAYDRDQKTKEPEKCLKVDQQQKKYMMDYFL